MTEQSAETRLLTLINVSSAKPTKRVRSIQRDWQQIARKALKSTKQQTATTAANGQSSKPTSESMLTVNGAGRDGDSAEKEDSTKVDQDNLIESSFDLHWSPSTALVEGKTTEEVQSATWSKSKVAVPHLGSVRQFHLRGSAQDQEQDMSIVRSA
jgi:hypothetical protein